MVFKEIKQHPLDYTILIAVSLVAMSLYLTPRVSIALKDILSFVLGFFYAGWGMWHHRRKKTLSVRVAIEYVFVGAMVALVLWLTLSY